MTNSVSVSISFKDKKTCGSYLGRNGPGHCHGLLIDDEQPALKVLRPLNSKGGIARCYIDIPADEVNGVCRALQYDELGLVLSRLKETGQLPLLMGLSRQLDAEIVALLKGSRP
jgi:hypothetical protein